MEASNSGRKFLVVVVQIMTLIQPRGKYWQNESHTLTELKNETLGLSNLTCFCISVRI